MNKKAMLLLAAWCLAAATCWAGRPMAFVSLGADDPLTIPGGNNVSNYIEWADEVGPRLQACGIVRVVMHNPGGYWVLSGVAGLDNRGMRVDQWLLAERARAPFSDRRDFRTAVGVLEFWGVEEIIVYVGSPTQLVDPENELPLVLKPFTDAGASVSIAFDAMFEDGIVGPGAPADWEDLWAANSPWRNAVARLRRDRKVYAEARLHPPQLAAGLGDLVDGTMADAQWDIDNPYDLSLQPGESIRVTHSVNEAGWLAAPWWPETEDWLSVVGVTPGYRSERNWGDLMDADLPPPTEFVDRNAEE